jgi:hypothetical protein
LTLIRETVRRLRSDVSRMDTLGRRAIASGTEAAGLAPSVEDRLQAAALAGDIASNTLYYSLVVLGKPSGSLASGRRSGPWLVGEPLRCPR